MQEKQTSADVRPWEPHLDQRLSGFELQKVVRGVWQAMSKGNQVWPVKVAVGMHQQLPCQPEDSPLSSYLALLTGQRRSDKRVG